MARFVLSDAQWAKMAPHCLGKPDAPGRPGADTRLFVEAVLWIARTGSPWRNVDAVEFATLEWVDWFNHRRLLEPIGNIPPAEAEARYYEQLNELAMVA